MPLTDNRLVLSVVAACLSPVGDFPIIFGFVGKSVTSFFGGGSSLSSALMTSLSGISEPQLDWPPVEVVAQDDVISVKGELVADLLIIFSAKTSNS